MSKRLRNWFLTINNPEDEEIQKISEVESRYCVWSWDTAPKTGTRHVHIYFEFAFPFYFSKLKKLFPRADIEPRRTTREACRQYILQKEKPVETGTFVETGHRTQLDEVQQMIHRGDPMVDIAEEYFSTWTRNYRALDRYADMCRRKNSNLKRNMYVEYVYGKPGLGKSHYAFNNCGDSWYVLTQSKSTESTNINVWFDGYEGEKCLIIDDFDGWIPYRFLLRILDVWPLRVEVKGSTVTALWERVIITSNVPVKHLYSDDVQPLLRRISKVVKLTENQLLPEYF